MTAPVTQGLQVRTWNLPALVMYFMPLKGLYFSPYISRRFTLSPGGKKEERSKAWASLRSSGRQLSGFVLIQKRLCGTDCLSCPFCEAEADSPAISKGTFAAKIMPANSSLGRRPPSTGKGRESSRLQWGWEQNNTVFCSSYWTEWKIRALMNNERKWTDQWRHPKQSCQTEQKLFCR